MGEIQESQTDVQAEKSLQIGVLQETGRFFPEDDIFYPDEDGKPMAASDLQWDSLVYCVDTLKTYFKADPDVYVSGDLLIYYERHKPGSPAKSFAPDVFVVFGIPKHRRRSYKIWEEGKSPDVVMEIASDHTWEKDIENVELCRRLGVKEYFLYDPTGNYFDPVLQGYRLNKNRVYQRIPLERLPGEIRRLDSQLLGLELHLESGELRLYNPEKQEYLLNHAEEQDGRLQEQDGRLRAEAACLRAEAARAQAEAARVRAEAQAEREKAQADKNRRETAATLVSMGVLTKEQIAQATGLSVEEIQVMTED